MITRFWHNISVRLDPYRGALIKALVVSLPSTLALFGIAAIRGDYHKWLFFALFVSTLAMMWSFGLLLLRALYRELPERPDSLPGQILHSWNSGMRSYGAVFLLFWFGFLIFMTVIAPISIIFSDPANYKQERSGFHRGPPPGAQAMVRLAPAMAAVAGRSVQR